MQKRFATAITLLVAFFVLSTGCKKSTNIGLNVPKDAAIVLHINSGELNKKLPWSEVKSTQWFQKAISDTATTAYMKAILDNPENSGIDLSKDLMIFLKKDSIGGYAAFMGSVKDVEKFKKFNAESTKSAAPTTEGNLSFYSGNNIISAFDKDRFAIVTDVPQMNEMDKLGSKKWPFDSTQTVDQPATASARDLKATAKSIFDLKKDNSIASDSRFADVVNEKGDMHFWVNMEHFYSSTWGGAAMKMFNFSKLYQGNATGGTINFDNGVITADAKSFTNKEMLDIWKKYKGNDIDASLLKRIPSDDIAFAMAFNIKPQMLVDVLKLAGMDGMANMGLALAGLNMEDITKAFKGDFVVAATDMKMDSMYKAKPNIIFSSTVGDETSFDKLLNMLKMSLAAKGKIGGQEPAFDKKNKLFAAGSDKAYVDKYLASSGNNSAAFIDKISGDAFGGYVNFQYILNTIKNDKFKDSLDLQMIELSKKTWDNALFRGGKLKGDAMLQHIQVNLLDKNTNSLKVLNTYLDQLAKIEEQKKSTVEKIEIIEAPGIAADTLRAKL